MQDKSSDTISQQSHHDTWRARQVANEGEEVDGREEADGSSLA